MIIYKLFILYTILLCLSIFMVGRKEKDFNVLVMMILPVLLQAILSLIYV